MSKEPVSVDELLDSLLDASDFDTPGSDLGARIKAALLSQKQVVEDKIEAKRQAQIAKHRRVAGEFMASQLTQLKGILAQLDLEPGDDITEDFVFAQNGHLLTHRYSYRIGPLEFFLTGGYEYVMVRLLTRDDVLAYEVHPAYPFEALLAAYKYWGVEP